MRTLEQRKDIEELAKQVEELEEIRKRQGHKIGELKHGLSETEGTFQVCVGVSVGENGWVYVWVQCCKFVCICMWVFVFCELVSSTSENNDDIFKQVILFFSKTS